MIFVQHKQTSLHQFLSTLLRGADIAATFPNLARLAAILIVLPVTTATVERAFSSMKLIKTRFRSRMGDNYIGAHNAHFLLKVRITDDTLEAVIDHYKHAKKKRKLAL